jgi:methyltransferase (TIGR00027 family)
MKDNQGSWTAVRVAERRALHQLIDEPRVFDDPLAVRILGAETERQMRATPQAYDRSPLSPYLRAAFVARSRFAEDELAVAVARGVRQYIVLGAGYDTFAYRNPYPDLRVFEVDHPATQAAKRQRLTEVGIEVPPSLTYVPIDFAQTSLPEVLAASGFDDQKPAFVSWLGVVPYLELDAIRATFRFITALPKGTTLVFDYGSQPSDLGLVGRFVFKRMAARVEAAGEPWKTFFAPADLLALLRESGFSLAEDSGPDDLNARYFAGRKDRLRIGKMAHLAKAVV